MLTIQGLGQLLPRQIFLRFSSFFQMAFFVLLLTVYFLQPGFTDLETLTDNQDILRWLPSYWFFGVFQQLSGPIRPELAFLPRRAWIGLAVAVSGLRRLTCSVIYAPCARSPSNPISCRIPAAFIGCRVSAVLSKLP